MKERQALQKRIETARAQLNRALKNSESVDSYYELSVTVDKLIEEYIQLCEEENTVRETFV